MKECYLVSSKSPLLSFFATPDISPPISTKINCNIIGSLKINSESDVHKFLEKRGVNKKYDWLSFERSGYLELLAELNGPPPLDSEGSMDVTYYAVVDINSRKLSTVKRLLKIEIIQSSQL